MDRLKCCLFIWLVFSHCRCTSAEHGIAPMYNNPLPAQFILRENTSKTITCKNDEIINITDAAFDNYTSLCHGQNNQCLKEIQKLRTMCNGRHHCEIFTDNFTSCEPKPRLISLTYGCQTSNYSTVPYRGTAHVCGSFQNISCANNYFISYIKSTYQYGLSNTDEPSHLGRCFKFYFDKFCAGNYHRCSGTLSPTAKTWCFYLTKSLNFQYVCIKKDVPSAKTSTRITISEQVTTTFVTKTFSGEVEVTRNSRKNLTCNDRETISISCVSFDKNKSNCSSGGKCKTDILTLYTTCNGLQHCEVSRQNFTLCQPTPELIVVKYGCKFKGSDHSSEPDSFIGIIIVTVVILVLLVAIAITVYIRKFRNGKGRKSESSRNISTIQYDLAADTSVPTNKETTNDNYSALEDIETGNKESHYMSTEEGVYDISNDRRHKMAENTEIYDRSVAGVYDETNHIYPKDDVTNIYDKSSDDVYDKAVHVYKPCGDTNELYDKCDVKVLETNPESSNEI